MGQLQTKIPASKTMADLKTCFKKWGRQYHIERHKDNRGATLYFDFLNKAVEIPCVTQGDFARNLRQLYLVAVALRIWDERGVLLVALGFFEQVKDVVLAEADKAAQDEGLLDAYGTLGVSPNDSIDEIKRIYAVKMQFVHPDKPGRTKADEEKARKLNNAFERICKARKVDG